MHCNSAVLKRMGTKIGKKGEKVTHKKDSNNNGHCTWACSNLNMHLNQLAVTPLESLSLLVPSPSFFNPLARTTTPMFQANSRVESNRGHPAGSIREHWARADKDINLMVILRQKGQKVETQKDEEQERG